MDRQKMVDRVYGFIMETCGLSCYEGLLVLDNVRKKIEQRQKHLKEIGLGAGYDWVDAENPYYVERTDVFYDVIKKPVVVRAMKMDASFSIETKEGKVNGKAGDYVIIDAEKNKHICAAETFENDYEFVRDGLR